jgi:hypothetical protein
MCALHLSRSEYVILTSRTSPAEAVVEALHDLRNVIDLMDGQDFVKFQDRLTESVLNIITFIEEQQ